ncbi:MAG: hypothetical protein NWE89_02365, partial [Candidatus Bathyarchaeota archaeon]|nr:hypothetical protein [Candidatus Bathyarchaeota archaeon]
MSKIGTNSLYYLLRFVRLVLRYARTNPELLYIELDKLLLKNETNLDIHIIGKTLETEDLRIVLCYFMDYGAATALILQQRLKLNESKV